MGEIKLWSLIAKRNWSEVKERIQTHPSESHSWEDGILPIHHICCHTNVPINVVESFIDVFPQSVKLKCKTKYHRIPLHYAARYSASSTCDVTEALLIKYRDGAYMKDEYGNTPLHSHLFYSLMPCIEVVKMLVEANPDSVCTGNYENWFPLHHAAGCGNWEISKFLVNLYPEALLVHTFSGHTPIDVANSSCKHEVCEKLNAEKNKLYGNQNHSSVTFTDNS